ncbi:MAG: hypothetical protein KDJ97_36020 [Anaerolineae bacterium]|nr:hypothetical protein [Anaerolineae bacterium]
MKKSIWAAAAIALVLMLFPLTTQASPLMGTWWVEYYNNPSLSGAPVVTLVERNIDHDWGFGSPNIETPPNNFSARWTNTSHFDRGTYLFTLTVDDGARVWLDGDLIIDAWDVGPLRERKAKMHFDEGGDHEVQVAYFDFKGPAVLKLDVIQLGGPHDIVGAWRGEYFNNRNLEGEPNAVRQDGQILFDWGYNAPLDKVAQDNFSVRWTRQILLERPGIYYFKVQHDDGMRIYVDDKIIYDSWYDQLSQYEVLRIGLKGGLRTFRVEHYEHIGTATAQLSIEPDPGDYSMDDVDPGDVGVVVTTQDVNFQWNGPPSSRFMSYGGYNESFIWTPNTNDVTVNSGRWRAPIGSAGNYEVYAYIPAEHSTTNSATYSIYHFDRIADRTINQNNYSNEFVSLGIYYFDGNDTECVILRDNTGEPFNTTEIAFDAIKFVKR